MVNQELVFTLEDPIIDKEMNRLINRVLSQRRVLLLVGNCWVDYEGRANSVLEPGERIVIIKSDGSLMVHRPRGSEAVNWQPPGCIFQSRIASGVFHLTATRVRPSEVLRIHFDRIYLLSSMKLEDAGRFSLYASEEDMQRAVLLRPALIEEGFNPISFEKRVEPGFVDVYGVDERGRFVVIEIKRNTAGRRAALQLSKYVKAVKDIVNREVRGILVAPDIAKGTQRLLVSLELEYRQLDPRKCAEILRVPKTRQLVEYF